uniref:Uncharacterized protein n=1 Tax=Anguilla anguilla TaxID=7936 RepID=A0A0E9R738_ANGAN
MLWWARGFSEWSSSYLGNG